MSSNIQIQNVSDTSLWVAYYRAKETERPDALFRDPLAQILVGARGKQIAENMKMIGRYTEWSVVTRTVIIDDYIQALVKDGVDMIINLGAGLDTRPYRMALPKTLKWVEVDHPHIIALKDNLLKNEIPRCSLTRIELDLTDDQKRKQFFKEVGTQGKKILIITEGVIPYLTINQVDVLATELHKEPSFVYWIAEYFSAEVYRHLKSSLRTKKMKNAPFQFFPNDWLGFFEKRGWVVKEIRFLGEEALKWGRDIPMPRWVGFLRIFFNKKIMERSKKMTGYILFKKPN